MYTACKEGRADIVKSLLQEYPNLDVNHEFWFSPSFLWLACSEGHPEVVQLLLKQKGIDVNKKSGSFLESSTLPLEIARYYEHTEVVRLLETYPNP